MTLKLISLQLSKENVHNISGLDISELDLPSRDLAGSIRHRSCALVGNSGALLGGNQVRTALLGSNSFLCACNGGSSALTPLRGCRFLCEGRAIDSHDAAMRVKT